MKILIPVDGSEQGNRAVQHVISSMPLWKQAPQIHLLNVQWRLATANVKLFISQDTINDYYREQGTLALKDARAMLDAAGIPYSYHIAIGTPAEAIVQYAQEQQADQIVMNAQGQGTLSELLLGSVAGKVARIAKVPVLLTR